MRYTNTFQKKFVSKNDAQEQYRVTVDEVEDGRGLDGEMNYKWVGTTYKFDRFQMSFVKTNSKSFDDEGDAMNYIMDFVEEYLMMGMEEVE